MLNLIKLETLSCISSIRFKITFGILFAVSIFNFLFTCVNYYGSNSTSVNIVYNAGIMNGSRARMVFHLFIIIMPIVVCCMYSDSYYKEKKANITTAIISRTGRKKYLIGKFIAIALISFFSVFFVLSVNELLTYISFNKKGSYANGVEIYKLNTFYDPTSFLSYINMKLPAVYNLLLIIVNSLYASILATFTFALSLVLRVKSLSIIVGTYAGTYLLDIFLLNVGLGDKLSMNMFQQGGAGTIQGFFFVVLLWILIIGTVFIMGLKKDTL